ncbi:dTDP-4-dehydrorhamnose reductase [Catellatospora chokoriensis]|uniref:dTDP-4-dehydrorhamnose reductase n=1 Tax=Catellatospora chokoriensis TaxID=310353 RepID=UPI00177F6B8A|nr:dTDP-4-dehydrorhamnose reductase [Catellatospora chokoriensis]
MKVLVTGAGGMLGTDLVTALGAGGFTAVAATRSDLDIRVPEQVAAALPGVDIVINAAAWTDVDRAETEEEAATAINGTAVGTLAAACAQTGARLIQISTDYVYSGKSALPWAESAATDPVNAYGRGKELGERAVFEHLGDRGYVVRTAWLYGAHGRNFVGTVLRLAAQRPTLDVVDDQHGQPTWTCALADQLIELCRAAYAGKAPGGVYHGTASGQTTWYGLARAVFESSGLDPDRVRPVDTAAFPRPAERPSYSVLGHDRWAAADIAVQPFWQDQLRAALARWPIR